MTRAHPHDLSGLPSGYALADRLPDADDMALIDGRRVAVCPYCGKPLLDYDHGGGRPALDCSRCRKVWLTTARPSWTSHERLLGCIVSVAREAVA